MMTPTLIVLALLVLGVGIVVWATRGKRSASPPDAPQESDTAWNDPVTPAGGVRPSDDRTATPPQEPRP